ncbi:MAG: beta-glucuronidase [Paludibacter sp.]|jgi:hypothetical protein|nr:beta-glucuronidase [Paludibacter sp.]
MLKYLKFTVLFFLLYCGNSLAQNASIDLSGTWQFAIDRNDVGKAEKWFAKSFDDAIYLPSSMNESRKGDDVTLHTPWTASLYDSTFFFSPRLAKYREQDNLKLPFWLTPVKYYVGVAWYQRTVEIPKNWKTQRVVLFLERPHIESTLWINNQEVGSENSLSVPHVFDVSKYLKAGKNTISVRIDNRMPDSSPYNVGKDSHSVTDQTQGNWNGIVGKLELRTMPTTYIDDVQVFPDVKNKKALVKIKIIGADALKTIELNANVLRADDAANSAITSVNVKQDISATKEKNPTLEIELPFKGNPFLWDEFHPNLYKLQVKLTTKNSFDTRETQFGMREFTIDGKYFYVNGQKTILRGTVENCDFPLTGYAPMDLESWVRVFRICKNFGLNHIRFHSYCPPEAAMQAADLVGLYLQPEGPSWPNHGSSLGDGRPVDDYLWNEAQSIVRQYGNYPSFCMFAIGNEPRGRWVQWVSKFVDYWKATDSRRVYTGASVGQSWAWQPKNQYHVKAGARGLTWDRQPETMSDFHERIDSIQVPYLSHEMGQWCVFPDFSEITKYTGVMRARNFELFREDLKDRNMGDLAAQFLQASGKLQALCYKHEIEKTLRTPGYAGFQMLALNDYSGQGTALVGLLNVFFEEKGYITAEQFRRFCAPTVLLARMKKFVFKNNETLTATIEVSHFGEKALKDQLTKWVIKDKFGSIVKQGNILPKNIEIGNCQDLGKIEFPLSQFQKAQKLTLELCFDGTDIVNDWDFWVYPSELPKVDTTQIFITENIDDKAKNILENGGKVLLLLNRKVEQGKDIVQHFTPSFWNTSWFKMRPPHTEGSLIHNFHPVFNDFPTDFYTAMQWWELTQKAPVMELTNFPADFQPIVQTIDTWFINRKLGMLFEANAGNGKIVVCSMDLRTNLENRSVARQMFYSIVNYMNSNKFFPEKTVNLSLIEDIMRKPSERINIDTQDAPDELKNVIL